MWKREAAVGRASPKILTHYFARKRASELVIFQTRAM